MWLSLLRLKPLSHPQLYVPFKLVHSCEQLLVGAPAPHSSISTQLYRDLWTQVFVTSKQFSTGLVQCSTGLVPSHLLGLYQIAVLITCLWEQQHMGHHIGHPKYDLSQHKNTTWNPNWVIKHRTIVHGNIVGLILTDIPKQMFILQ